MTGGSEHQSESSEIFFGGDSLSPAFVGRKATGSKAHPRYLFGCAGADPINPSGRVYHPGDTKKLTVPSEREVTGNFAMAGDLPHLFTRVRISGFRVVDMYFLPPDPLVVLYWTQTHFSCKCLDPSAKKALTFSRGSDLLSPLTYIFVDSFQTGVVFRTPSHRNVGGAGRDPLGHRHVDRRPPRMRVRAPPRLSLPQPKAVVSKVSELEGNASYATVRGKKKYIYEFALTINWAVALGDDRAQNCTGEMTFPDIDGTMELGEGYDIAKYAVDASSQVGTGPMLERFVRDGRLRDSIQKTIDDWVRLFRATY